MKRVQLLILSIILLSFGSCKQKESHITAQEIIDKAIDTAGGDKFSDSRVSFSFRDKQYVSSRGGGSFEYQRNFEDSTGAVVNDILTNDGFVRTIGGKPVEVADSMGTKYSNSINSVIYFAFLPYGLNDDAVKKELLGEVSLKEEPYYKIKVSFDKNGGGVDFEDVFVYWVHKHKFTVDYLAYEYHTDGGGIRFREAYNARLVDGIRFTDYNNFKPKQKDLPLMGMDTLFEGEKLQLLSTIELKGIGVKANH